MNAIDQQMDAVQSALIKLKTDLKKRQSSYAQVATKDKPNSPKALELIERIKELEIDFWGNGFVFLDRPTFLTLGADHRIKSSSADPKVHIFGS